MNKALAVSESIVYSGLRKLDLSLWITKDEHPDNTVVNHIGSAETLFTISVKTTVFVSGTFDLSNAVWTLNIKCEQGL